MKSRITPYFVELVFDATWKSFWRKDALSTFLYECGVPNNLLVQWGKDESKRIFLGRLFNGLLSNDDGRRILVALAKNLVEKRSFPDLKGWENSEKMIAEANEAIAILRKYCNKQEEEIQSEEDRLKATAEFRRKQEEISKYRKTLQMLSSGLNDLSKKIGTQEAGYEFQDWFYDLIDFFEIISRRPYVHGGRQIDGSITVSGTTYLIELKFSAEQAAANDIDTFYKKVTSKADNTMGVMVSISGFSAVAIKEASGDKTPLLLLDYNHLYMVLYGLIGVSDLIERVRRHASQTGEAYLKAEDFSG